MADDIKPLAPTEPGKPPVQGGDEQGGQPPTSSPNQSKHPSPNSPPKPADDGLIDEYV
ncbi:hypothetical protein Q7C_1272 [Methylophaga frappieri]|uniref:Uncharacterized protein n=1 Tax=Methylophaga frappieri (strain ATCC BAA-2434 / DSM 25690 / JAM7) TaxID=754477 RepID=I1YHM9_METFJ|nr:hypothetical protein [Methylophaga frappieri]AFJ02422.1 hypothetical protein Q7C_1272 [Methylophaga frappieri]